MAVFHQNVALRVNEVVGEAAELVTLSPVGAAAGCRETGIAGSAIAHTQGSVDKRFYGHCHGPPYLGCLFEGEFACYHYLTHAAGFQKSGALGGADIALGACMKGYRGKVHAQDAEVLNDERVGSGSVEAPNHFFDAGEFVGHYDSVERHIYAGVKAVGIVGGAGNIGDRNSGSGSRAVGGRADIHSVGSMTHSFYGNVGVAGRREEFERTR